MSLHIGIAGWDYADWDGVVYPARTPRGFDKLIHVGSFVDLVEINSTFYRPVAPRVADSWVRRTRDLERFRFTAKVHRSWTHEAGADPDEVVPPTLAGLAPLRDAGKLVAVLLQFPQSFHRDDAALERIERLAEALGDWPAVVEVRHRSWNTDEVAEWFRARGLGWCAVDQPSLSSTAPTLTWVTSPVAYLRLHGRNAANWFRPDAGRDARYDYLYTSGQIEKLAGAARKMSQQAESLVVVQNNHFRGQALVNALQMKHVLEGRRPRAPEELVAAFPELEPDVTVERTRLF